MGQLSFDIAIATKDRVKALELSIPLMLSQSRLPNKFIVVDASNDHEQVVGCVNRLLADSGVHYEIIQAPANLPRQRNIAMEHVESPIVMFPDDDALWHDGVAESIMRIYERDVDGRIGGVCGAPATESPLDSAKRDQSESVQMSFADKLRHRVERLRHKIDDAIWPDPFWILGRSLWKQHDAVEWLQSYNASLVEYMGGYRMSFRSDILRNGGGFDSDLGGRLGWAAGEDADASFKVMQDYLVVGARDAKVFHHRFPGARGNGFLVGMFVVLNRAYVVGKYSHPKSPERNAVRRFAISKLCYYSAEGLTAWGRDRVRGVRYAMSRLRQLLDCEHKDLKEIYLDVIDKGVAAS